MHTRSLYRVRIPLRYFVIAAGRASAVYLAAKEAHHEIHPSSAMSLVEQVTDPEQLPDSLRDEYSEGEIGRLLGHNSMLVPLLAGEEGEPPEGSSATEPAAYGSAHQANLAALPDAGEDAPEVIAGERLYRFRVTLDVLVLADDPRDAIERAGEIAYETILAESTSVRIERILDPAQLSGEERHLRPRGSSEHTVLRYAERELELAPGREEGP